MIYFVSDYSQGAHQKVLDALQETNAEHYDGYGIDSHCENAAKIIKSIVKNDKANVHFMVGGTPVNVTTITSALRPYECVIAAHSGHINMHETGGVEARGHKIYDLPSDDGKLTPAMIQPVLDEYEDEHMAIPRMVYISNTTEVGTIYKKSELEALSKYCKSNDLLLYLDGARIGTAITAEGNDLTIEDIAKLVDAFYIGGTKNGMLFGEALIILNDDINKDFRHMMKQSFGLLAKGRLLGVQFEALFDDGLNSTYFDLARHSNAMAKKLREGISELGYDFLVDSPTNQIFPILPISKVEELEKDFMFYRWEPPKGDNVTIRLVTSFTTTEDEINTFLDKLKL